MDNGFVPSYKNEEERLEIRKEKDRKLRIRTTIITTIVIVIVIASIILGYTLLNKNYSIYEKYEEKMNIYGFSKVYDDGDCNTRDSVTKSEAVKMLIASVYNVSNIEGRAMPTDKTYSNAIWVEYAIKQGIVGASEVNEETADEKAKYQDVLVWLYNIKAKMLDVEPDTAVNYNIKDINAYNADTQLAIYDLLNSNIIVENTKRVNGTKKLYKGKLNELIINFVEEYNRITVGDARININEEKIPENANMYPYTLASVQKDIYEIPFKNDGSEGFISPIEYYPDNKEYYGQIKNYVEGYYGYLMNINYEDISVAKMKRSLKKYAYEEFDDEKIKKYVDYVINNKIKLTGTATAQLPCVYFDGKDYRARIKLEFSVESSNTDANLLYYDLESNGVTYKSDKITIYVDTVMNKLGASQTLFIKEGTISSILAKSSSSIVSKGE